MDKNQEPNPLSNEVLHQLAAIAGNDQAVATWQTLGQQFAAFWRALVAGDVPEDIAAVMAADVLVGLIVRSQQ
jgi:hypothetical protein